jgi:hypothetical protein
MAVVPAFDLPHGVQPERLMEPLAGEYSRRLLDVSNPAAAIPLGPGGRFDPRADPTLATFRNEIDRLSAAAVNVLVPPVPADSPARGRPIGGTGCGKCHDLEPAVSESSRPTVPPIATPTVWFPGARFNHMAHRGVSCARCHPGTTAGEFGSGWTSEKEPVRIAGVASCRECHGPPRTADEFAAGPRLLGGVKHGCTDCHTYHNACRPLAGKGTSGRNPAGP